MLRMMRMMMISHPLSPGPVDPSFHDLSGCESHCRRHLCEDWPNALIVAQSKGLPCSGCMQVFVVESMT